MKDILDLHSHTIFSGHAYSTLTENVKAAAERGLVLYGCADHSLGMRGILSPWYFSNFGRIPRELYGVRILIGAEFNIMDEEGHIDFEPDKFSWLDYGIAGFHIPCYRCTDAAKNTETYIKVMQNPRVNIIAHPDDSRYPVDYEKLVAAAKRYHKLLELNNSSLRPESGRKNARENDLVMLELCRQYQTPVILGSDAHFWTEVGDHERALALLAEISFPEELVVNFDEKRIFEFI